MTPEQLQQFEDTVVAATDAHLATGGKVLAYSFSQGSAMCPIACLGIQKESANIHLAISQKLGFSISDEELWDFIYGFDGLRVLVSNLNSDTYLLGRKLRDKYLPRS